MAEPIAGTNKTPHCAPAAPEGLLLLRKKSGLTSFDALREVKRALGTSKVGHTGTLDKFAQGILPVLAGRAVKLSPWFTHADKQYRGNIHFGPETDTLDPEGQLIAQEPPPSRQAVEDALARFRGEILQAPPAYSAIHLGGKRASELARSGETPEMKKRPVTIYRLDLVSWEPPFAEIEVHCSSGTYIRSLARDLALAAGSRGHLAALTRTRFAGFDLSQAASGEGEALAAALKPIDRTVIAALGLPAFEISAAGLQNFIHGKPISHVLAGAEFRGSRTGGPDAPAAAVFCGEEFAGIIERRPEKGWAYGYVYAAGRGHADH
jgi:tRNA pseudouridine55 synthase